MSDNDRCTFDEASHTYRVNGVEVPGVSAILGLAGLEPAFSVDPVTLALAAERGLGIHLATAIDDRHALGIGPPLDPETVDPEFLPYLNAWRMFRDIEPWVTALNGIERKLYAPTHRFAGTADRVGQWRGQLAVLDIKTGKELRWQMGVQVAGYAVAVADDSSTTVADDVGRVLVHLRNNATYQVYASDDGSGKDYLACHDVDTFMAALHIAHRKLARPRTKLPQVAPETGDVEVA